MGEAAYQNEIEYWNNINPLFAKADPALLIPTIKKILAQEFTKIANKVEENSISGKDLAIAVLNRSFKKIENKCLEIFSTPIETEISVETENKYMFNKIGKEILALALDLAKRDPNIKEFLQLQYNFTMQDIIYYPSIIEANQHSIAINKLSCIDTKDIPNASVAPSADSPLFLPTNFIISDKNSPEEGRTMIRLKLSMFYIQYQPGGKGSYMATIHLINANNKSVKLVYVDAHGRYSSLFTFSDLFPFSLNSFYLYMTDILDLAGETNPIKLAANQIRLEMLKLIQPSLNQDSKENVDPMAVDSLAKKLATFQKIISSEHANEAMNYLVDSQGKVLTTDVQAIVDNIRSLLPAATKPDLSLHTKHIIPVHTSRYTNDNDAKTREATPAIYFKPRIDEAKNSIATSTNKISASKISYPSYIFKNDHFITLLASAYKIRLNKSLDDQEILKLNELLALILAAGCGCSEQIFHTTETLETNVALFALYLRNHSMINYSFIKQDFIPDSKEFSIPRGGACSAIAYFDNKKIVGTEILTIKYNHLPSETGQKRQFTDTILDIYQYCFGGHIAQRGYRNALKPNENKSIREDVFIAFDATQFILRVLPMMCGLLPIPQKLMWGIVQIPNNIQVTTVVAKQPVIKIDNDAKTSTTAKPTQTALIVAAGGPTTIQGALARNEVANVQSAAAGNANAAAPVVDPIKLGQ